jgi:hypothetical protein
MKKKTKWIADQFCKFLIADEAFFISGLVCLLLYNIIYLETGVVLTTLVVFETTVVTFKNVVIDDVLFGVVKKCDVELVCDVVE